MWPEKKKAIPKTTMWNRGQKCEYVVKLSTLDEQVDDNEAKIYGHEEIEVRTSFAIFLQKMIPQFEAEVSLVFKQSTVTTFSNGT